MSNIAEVSSLLGWSSQKYITELMHLIKTSVYSNTTPLVKRSAIFILIKLIDGLHSTDKLQIIRNNETCHDLLQYAASSNNPELHELGTLGLNLMTQPEHTNTITSKNERLIEILTIDH